MKNRKYLLNLIKLNSKNCSKLQLTLPMETFIRIPQINPPRHINEMIETINNRDFDEFSSLKRTI
ncbi:hypothetical protein K4U63_10830 [Staphylococcus epidermidis]|nr:hypothetical protein [Staphylococcus epidermidis]